jgi:hypothetical protein
MPFSDSELQSLYGDLSPVGNATAPIETQPDSAEVPFKRLKQVANILPNVGNALATSAASLDALVNENPEQGQQEIDYAKHLLPTFDVGPSKGITDIALNTVAPEMAAWMVPYVGVGKIAKGLGAGAALTEGLAQGGANFISSIKESPDLAADQGGLGLVSGVLQSSLPRAARILPLAGVSALEGYKSGNYLGAGLNFAMNMLPGAHLDVTTPTYTPGLYDEALMALGEKPNPLSNLGDAGTETYSPADLQAHDVFSSVENSGLNIMTSERQAINNLHELQNSPAPIDSVTDLKLSQDQGPLQSPLTNTVVTPSGLDLESNRFSKSISDSQPYTTEDLQPHDIFSGLKLESPELQSEIIHPQDETPSGLNLSSDKIENHLSTNPGEPKVIESTPTQQSAPSLSDANQPESLKPSSSVEAPPNSMKQMAYDVFNSKENTTKIEGSTEEKQAIIDAYNSLAEDSGTPNVKISDVLDEAKIPYQKGTGIIAAMHEAGDISQLSSGDWSQASIKNRAAGVRTPSTEDPALLMKMAQPKAQELPTVLMPDGTTMNIQPLMDGPHIISTVITDGETHLAGTDWNTTHRGPAGQFDYPSIMNQQMDGPNLAETLAADKSGFLLRDKSGNIRVTTNRAEALEVAKEAGQTTKQNGNLHSQDLVEQPNPPAPKNVQEHLNVEKSEDADQIAKAKQIADTKAQLQANLDQAKQGNDSLKIRIAARKLREFLQENDPENAEALSMKAANKAQAGFADPKTLRTLAIMSAAGLTGVVTYQRTKGDMGATIAAGLIVLGLGTVGSKAFRDLKGIVGEEVKAPNVKVPDATIAERVKNFSQDTITTPAGMAVGNHAGMWAGAMKGLEDVLGWRKMAETFKDYKLKAQGFVDDILNQQIKALAENGKVKPSDSFAEATTRYIRGQLNDPVEVQNLLNSGGMISGEGSAWNKLTAAQKANYPEKWMQLDDQLSTNTKGDGVTIWHVTNSVKNQLLKGEQDALMRLATTPEDKKFAQYAITTRGNLDSLMQVIHAAAGPKQAGKLVGTMGQYATRAHSILTDPKFYPDDATIQKTMDVLAHTKINDFLSSVEKGPIPITYGTQIYHVSPNAADTFNNLFTPESLRAVVTQQIKELKSIGAGRKAGLFATDDANINGNIFTGRKEIDAVRQALLGTHTNPTQIIQDTFNKLLPAAQASHQLLDLTRAIEESGLPGRFESEVQYNKAINDLKGKLALASDPRMQRTLTNQLNELKAYIPIGNDNPSMALMQGSFVSRHVHAQLDDAMQPFGMLQDQMGKGLSNFNRIYKETHLVWNPVTQARNFAQIPMFLVMGKAAHDADALSTAFNIVFKDNTTDIGRWATRNGALSANPVKGELDQGFRQLLDGTTDNKIWDLFQKARGFVHGVYSKPDDFVRTAVFIAAAKRSAKELGVPLDQMHLSQEVTDAAREFMSRRTMDYGNVPNWVKMGRQIPLVSTFLSYSHEIVRITKNMAVDAAKGDLVSGASLAALSVFPFLAQQQAINNLSPKDKADWLRGNNATQDYSRPRFKLPMSRNKDGSFNYYDITPLMPFGDYLGLGRSLAAGDYRAALANNPIAGIDNSPALNLIASQVTGKDLHTQRDFRDGWDRTKNVLSQIAPPLTPGIGGDWDKLAPEELGGSLNQVNMKTGRTSTIKGALLRNTIGLDESQLQPDIAVSNSVKGAQSDIANERAYLRDVLLQNGISEEAKKRATDRYVFAVHKIVNQLNQRINPQQ